MTAVAGHDFGIVGALAAFPRRLAAREVERQRGRLRRGVSRRSADVIFGRKLLGSWDAADIEARVDVERKAGRRLLSENGFLRLLGLLPAPEGTGQTRRSLIDQSKLGERDVDLLSLFDAFESDREPYSFRDLILARKYAGLVAGGASWDAIATAVHRSGPIASLTARALHADGSRAIYARHGDGLSELDGQMLFDLSSDGDVELDEAFAEAEAAEEAGAFEAAADWYRRCLEMDPCDPVAAFNRANCLRAMGREAEAAHDYARALKLDPKFVEAWFNLAGLMSDKGSVASARRHLHKAIALDGDYPDAVFNLAKLEYDCGNLSEARRWWMRYLELDSQSDWARTAARGVQFIDLTMAKQSAG